MTGLGCVFKKDVSEKGCEISCSSQVLLSGDMHDIHDIHSLHNIHNIHT